ncbi:hypothetical protein C8Q77DRAFT_489576 [Trametes polyzona]|nr:hypothetical protein C8Q77DRAFT_489576 [Trametes polyzona]
MPSAYDILGVVFGVIGVVSSIPVLLHWVQKRLPLARIAELDRVMAGMKALLDDDARRDEFLDEAERYSFQQRLAGLRQRAWRPRMLAYQATTSAARFRSLFSGLSREIGELHDEALQLRLYRRSSRSVRPRRLTVPGRLHGLSATCYGVSGPIEPPMGAEAPPVRLEARRTGVLPRRRAATRLKQRGQGSPPRPLLARSEPRQPIAASCRGRLVYRTVVGIRIHPTTPSERKTGPVRPACYYKEVYAC